MPGPDGIELLILRLKLPPCWLRRRHRKHSKTFSAQQPLLAVSEHLFRLSPINWWSWAFVLVGITRLMRHELSRNNPNNSNLQRRTPWSHTCL